MEHTAGSNDISLQNITDETNQLLTDNAHVLNVFVWHFKVDFIKCSINYIKVDISISYNTWWTWNFRHVSCFFLFFNIFWSSVHSLPLGEAGRFNHLSLTFIYFDFSSAHVLTPLHALWIAAHGVKLVQPGASWWSGLKCWPCTRSLPRFSLAGDLCYMSPPALSFPSLPFTSILHSSSKCKCRKHTKKNKNCYNCPESCSEMCRALQL